MSWWRRPHEDQSSSTPPPLHRSAGSPLLARGRRHPSARLSLAGLAVLLIALLLAAPGAAGAAAVVPPLPPPTPSPTAPSAPPTTPPGPGRSDTAPAPSNPRLPLQGPPTALERVPAEAARALPFSTAPSSPDGITCYIVIDKVTPTKPVSNVVAEGCHNGPRIPPVLDRLLPGSGAGGSPGGPPTPRPRSAPMVVQSSAVPLAELYSGTNYSGSSRIIYGSGGGCDALGYRISDTTTQNSQLGGISSYRTYNNCSNQAIHNQPDFAGTANFFTGYNRASLPSGYDNNLRSMRLNSVPCTYYNETNASVCGLIRDKYNALGGPAGPLGFPTSNELTNPDRVGKRSTFQGATSIYWTPATGAHDVRGPLRDAWARNGWETGVLGYPVSDQLGLVDNQGRVNRFFKNNTYAAGTPTRTTGSVYWSPATNAHAVTGAISDKYSALGGTLSALGYPTTDEQNTSDNGGRQNTFFANSTHAAGTPVRPNGNIIWSAVTGAWEVHGPIRAKYLEVGDVQGCFGYPISDVEQVSGGEQANFTGADEQPPYESPATIRFDSATQVITPSCVSSGGSSSRPCTNNPPLPGSVDESAGRELAYGMQTKYTDGVAAADRDWSALGSVNVTPTPPQTFEDVTVLDTPASDQETEYTGLWDDDTVGTDEIYLNDFYLQTYTPDVIQGVVEHEFGHALRLGHRNDLGALMHCKDDRNAIAPAPSDVAQYRSLWG